LTDRLAELRARIDRAARAAGRAQDEIRLVAVSKTFPASLVLAAADAGLSTFGENRVQEAAQKIPEVAKSSQRDLRWHLVGQLQRNKARKAITLFDVIESVDRLELAAELERAATAVGKEQEILIQVNIDEEPQKGGVLPAQLTELLTTIDALPHLRPLGLMTVPQACADARSAPAAQPGPSNHTTALRALHGNVRGLRDRDPGGRKLDPGWKRHLW
jgi:pyridoxal phosphate enzyme (YggS family)